MDRSSFKNYKYDIEEMAGYMEVMLEDDDMSLEKAIQICMDMYQCEHSDVIAALKINSIEKE